VARLTSARPCHPGLNLIRSGNSLEGQTKRAIIHNGNLLGSFILPNSVYPSEESFPRWSTFLDWITKSTMGWSNW
jgi:hypothetical protein